jgi:imidazolonepropionase-like amidohydrolase
MGMGDEIGTLHPGKLADFLVVDGNPLDDVRILEDHDRLKLIVKEGKVFHDSLRLIGQDSLSINEYTATGDQP